MQLKLPSILHKLIHGLNVNCVSYSSVGGLQPDKTINGGDNRNDAICHNKFPFHWTII